MSMAHANFESRGLEIFQKPRWRKKYFCISLVHEKKASVAFRNTVLQKEEEDVDLVCELHAIACIKGNMEAHDPAWNYFPKVH